MKEVTELICSRQFGRVPSGAGTCAVVPVAGS